MVASFSVEPRTGELIQIERIGQYVPSRVCLACEVCCRFPDADSFLRPYFTGDEIRAAVSHGLSPSSFRDHAGCQVEVQPHPAGEGCRSVSQTMSGCLRRRPVNCTTLSR